MCEIIVIYFFLLQNITENAKIQASLTTEASRGLPNFNGNFITQNIFILFPSAPPAIIKDEIPRTNKRHDRSELLPDYAR